MHWCPSKQELNYLNSKDGMPRESSLMICLATINATKTSTSRLTLLREGYPGTLLPTWLDVYAEDL